MRSMENVSSHLLKNTGGRICLVAKGDSAVDMSAVRNREREIAAGLIDIPTKPAGLLAQDSKSAFREEVRNSFALLLDAFSRHTGVNPLRIFETIQPEWVRRMQRCSTASPTMELESINFSAAHFRRSRKK
jgi:hypothetical protein